MTRESETLFTPERKHIYSTINSKNIYILSSNNYILKMVKYFEDCASFKTLQSFFNSMKGVYIILVVQASNLTPFPS